MGMAASQARYLALVARQSNCEYEGQQINQARLNLSNQSANLFNQMLGLSVPVPPSVKDFTKAQYSFSDGINSAVIDRWEQLANPDNDGYNYMVEYHYEAEVYKGFERRMSNPQIQFPYGLPSSDAVAMKNAVSAIHAAQVDIANAEDAYKTAKEKYENWKAKVSNLTTYRNSVTFKDRAQRTNHVTNGYAVFDDTSMTNPPTQFYSADLINVSQARVNQATLWTDATGNIYAEYASGRTAVAPDATLYEDATTHQLYSNDGGGSYTALTSAQMEEYLQQTSTGELFICGTTPPTSGEVTYGSPTLETDLQNYLNMWADMGIDVDLSQVYYSLNSSGNIEYIAFKDDLDSLKGVDQGLMTTLYVYNTSGTSAPDDPYQTIDGAYNLLTQYKTDAENAYADLLAKQTAYTALNVPNFLGNTELTSLGELTQEDMAEIKQIIADMTANGADCEFTKCFTSSLNIDINHYTGGIYSFVRDGVKYYTTYYDLVSTANASTFTNEIDNQPKLKYYNATYVKDNISSACKAILDTDSQGRFKTVRFEDSGMIYTLNFEQVTDDAAYQDAMNQYYYKNAQYDKMVQDINAKTSIIQQQDQELELRLKQLDTERNALSNEIDAVSKVVKDNVEASFKTFGG
ncbi:MAG: hypothetical protein MJ230_04975 [bacterium]|nr:hypothetical protein [bacterium]